MAFVTMPTIYTDFCNISELQYKIMSLIDIWVHEKKIPTPRSEIIKSMQIQGVNMPTVRSSLYSLIRKGYIREAVTVSNKTSYVQLRRI